MQITTLQLTVVVVSLHLQIELCMRAIMRHLDQQHIMLATPRDGQLAVLDISLESPIRGMQYFRRINSQTLWIQNYSRHPGSLLRH